MRRNSLRHAPHTRPAGLRPVLGLLGPLLIALALPAGGCSSDREPHPARHFIAHRGATMRCTLAGENSREAILLAAAAGFDCIETDVRCTADSVLVAVHDATLARTFTRSDGSPVAPDIAVADLTYAQLRDGFRLKAARPEYRTRVLTLEDFCRTCRDCGLRTFIEPKDPFPEWAYPKLLAVADSVFGRGAYVVTSNNRANDHIRFELGLAEIPLMGILYQSTYEHIASLGNTVMAVSATRFDAEEYSALVSRARADGFETESHADDFAHFDRIDRAGVDYISTDLLAPDYRGQGTTRCLAKGRDTTRLAAACARAGRIGFGALYLDFTWRGSATLTLADRTFALPEADTPRRARFQPLLFDTEPRFAVDAPSDGFRIDVHALRVVEFRTGTP